MISGVAEQKIRDPLRPLKELYRFKTHQQVLLKRSEFKFSGFAAFGMDSYTNPTSGQENRLSIDLKLEESYTYKFGRMTFDQSARYVLSYFRINEFVKDDDDLNLTNSFEFNDKDKVKAIINCELETGVLNTYEDDSQIGMRKKVSSILSPGTLNAGPGARFKIKKLRIDVSLPQLKIMMLLDEKLFDINGVEELAGVERGEKMAIETGYKITLSAKHAITPDLDIRSGGNVFASNDNFRNMDFHIDNELGIKFNKFLRSELRTKLRYDGIHDPTLRFSNLLKFGFYF